MFSFIKEKLKKIYSSVSTKMNSLFSKTVIDENFFEELYALLISSDTGIETTEKVIRDLKNMVINKKITDPKDIKKELEIALTKILTEVPKANITPTIILLVGINGSGKTTFAGKLAHNFKISGKKILLVAADTFRAAAVHQLQEWGQRLDLDIFTGKDNQDPSSVIFDACKKFKNEGYDHLIIDTAGRVQTKVNLMKELTKMRNTINKQLSDRTIATWLTIDAMLGQNSFEQAKLFNEATKLDGIVLTKLDGTGKGGILFSITKQLHLPIIYVTFGESIDELKIFDTAEYVKELLG
jgi:fused signal recognition particle receptor